MFGTIQLIQDLAVLCALIPVFIAIADIGHNLGKWYNEYINDEGQSNFETKYIQKAFDRLGDAFAVYSIVGAIMLFFMIIEGTSDNRKPAIDAYLRWAEDGFDLLHPYSLFCVYFPTLFVTIPALYVGGLKWIRSKREYRRLEKKMAKLGVDINKTDEAGPM